MTSLPRIRPFGERALFVELAETFSDEAVARSRALADAWEADGRGSAVPSYASVVLHYDPASLTDDDAERAVRELLTRPAPDERVSGARLIDIATRYDGPDLADVARLSSLSVDELVRAHAAREYTAYFLGFLPGFAYLGRLDRRIVAPRLDRPREHVPAGTVAVADGQTAVYPFASPGGWRLIGSTDVRLFDPARDTPALLRPGDRVRFVAS